MAQSRLDLELVERGLAATRSKAQQLIKAGAVVVNGELRTKSGYEVCASDKIEILEEYENLADSVGRGALKLRRALEYWGLQPRGVCLDIGASTGGFTQVLIEHGADLVFAVDVGQNQLADRLKADRRVVSLEKTDVRSIRNLDFIELIAKNSEKYSKNSGADFITCDVSFISATKIVGAIKELAAPGADIILLVKPQFESESRRRLKNGVVKSDSERKQAVNKVVSAAKSAGLGFVGVIESPVSGGSGNIEYLTYFVNEQKN